MSKFSFRPALDLRGRQFRGLRGFAGKPFHPPLTDVTVGAYFLGPLLGLVGYVFADRGWAGDVFRSGGIVLLVGAISSVATIATGWADWLDTEKGTQMRRMANAHAMTMLTTTAVVLADLAYRFLGDAPDGPSGLLALGDLVIMGLVTLGGTLGGALTYDWGFNVETATDSPVWSPSEQDVLHPR